MLRLLGGRWFESNHQNRSTSKQGILMSLAIEKVFLFVKEATGIGCSAKIARSIKKLAEEMKQSDKTHGHSIETDDYYIALAWEIATGRS